MKIRVFRLDDMRFTPFSDSSKYEKVFFSRHDIELTESPFSADVFVLSRLPSGFRNNLRYSLRYIRRRPVLLWTSEPRFDRNLVSIVSHGLSPIHVMNVYTKDAFCSNYTYIAGATLYGYGIKGKLPLAREKRQVNNKAVFLGTYIERPNEHDLYLDNRNIDLSSIRQELALAGYRRGLLDIYGKGWPDAISIEDSRHGNWVDRKLQILENYQFNLCLENTNIDYYCTEKIWDSIKGGCLPIYFGKNNRIYETFPRGSFIDAADFKSVNDTWDFIEAMTNCEYTTRMNKCIDVYNTHTDIPFFEAEHESMLMKIVAKLRAMLDSGV